MPIETPASEYFLEAKQQIVINVLVALMCDHVDYPCNTFLTLLKFEGLFTPALLIVYEQRLNKFNELVDGAR